MRFPKFPYKTKQHMPFIGNVNGDPEYLVCLADMDSSIWKIYRYDAKWGYERLTNSPDNVIECNPSVEQNGDKIIYSWSYQTDKDMGGGVVHSVNQSQFEDFSNKKVIQWDDIQSMEKRPYGIYHAGEFFTRIDLKEKIHAEIVLHIQVYSENQLIVSYIENSVKKSGLYDMLSGNIIKELKDSSGAYLYKPCCYNKHWFSVITLDGNNQENRFVIPVEIAR